MKKKLIIGLLACALLLSHLTTTLLGSGCDPPCTGCQNCEDGVCVDRDYLCPDCHYCYMGTCIPYGDCGGGCPTCESCVSCWCQCTSECCEDSDCTGECHNGCSGCNCVDDESKCPGECDTCDDGTCTDHDYLCNWRLCETCNDGECEDRCPALGKYCNYDTGMCEVCVDDFHCELCEECNVLHECVHPCDDCTWPKYCGYACFCVECNYNYGQEDTTTCSTANSTTECHCSINLFSPCSSTEESVVYSGFSLKSCTGPDCDPVSVLCYTTYETCRTSGDYQPYKWCGGDVLPPTCVIDVYQPGPGCWTCVNSFESGFPTYESQGDCPIEDWPE